MKFKDKKALKTVQLRATRKISEIKTSLIPELMEEMSAETLSRHLGSELSNTAQANLQQMCLRMAVAVADLDVLKSDLSLHRDAVAEELRRLGSYRSAARAYQRTLGVPPKRMA